MSHSRKPGLEDAYSVETPEDNRRLYADWAGTYDTDFVAGKGYVAYQRVAEQLAARLSNHSAEVLDAGCGTGACGAALRQLGFRIVDGIDLSGEMLAEAGKKTTVTGEPVYRGLEQVDLTGSMDRKTECYDAIVSAGTFTHGHLGPGALDTLWRFAAPGAICAIGINARHYRDQGFASRIATEDESGVIGLLDIVETDTYAKLPPDLAAGDDKTMILVCRVNPRPGSG